MNADQPATIPVALAGVLSTGVAFFALFVPFLQDPVAQGATIAFGNALILAGVVIFLNRNTTSSKAPVVESGTPVGIVGSDAKVIAQPPNSVDVVDGQVQPAAQGSGVTGGGAIHIEPTEDANTVSGAIDEGSGG